MVVCLSLTAGAASTRAFQSAAARSHRSHRIQTFFLILMENHNWSSIAGSPSAPYVNHELLRLGAHATRYYNPPGNHPSLPNYLWLEAGKNFGISGDGPPSEFHQSTHLHLTTLLGRARVSWRFYEENITGKSCPLSDSFPYATRHNPGIYFDDVTNRMSSNSRTCISHERPFGQFTGDLAHRRVARYNFITPNLCDDMHDSCAPLNDSIRQGDRWLSRVIPPILRSVQYRRGGAIFITWDEGEGGDGPIGMIVLSPDARPRYAGALHYTHSSTLRTIEEIFNVKPLLGDAAHARDLSALFRHFP